MGNPMHTCPYEVGDVLTTSNATHPSARWPGTSWTAVESFILGASAAHPAGETGGEEAVTLTTPEMPSHKHFPSDGTNDRSWVISASDVTRYHLASGTAAYVPGTTEMDGWTWGSTAATGGGQPHNNMPPYKAYYIWERTA